MKFNAVTDVTNVSLMDFGGSETSSDVSVTSHVDLGDVIRHIGLRHLVCTPGAGEIATIVGKGLKLDDLASLDLSGNELHLTPSKRTGCRSARSRADTGFA